MMKKNFIYSLCILLCGTIFMSSCEDMLDVDSDRVHYDMSKLTLNDTVYSVLGILKNVQAVTDRQVLLGELRGDLMTVNEQSAVTDIQKISRFEFDGENEYLNVKDYYAIINNCNIYLQRCDTMVENNNQRPLVREYVGVKSVRAWAYMQLAMNYGNVPFFTQPILTHSLAEEVAKQPRMGMQEIAPILIEDLLPFQNSESHPMPAFAGLDFKTSLYFMPIRQLLGDLYLWTKQYKEAAQQYYELIDEEKYCDRDVVSRWNDEEAKGRELNMSTISERNTTALVSFSESSSDGTVSNLGNIIYTMGVAGSHMIQASNGYFGLSKNQVYYYHNGKAGNSAIWAVNPSEEVPGDLRLYSNTQEMMDREEGIAYPGVIAKFGMGTIETIQIGRSIQLYLRLAEALTGLAAQGGNTGENGEFVSDWQGAKELAMTILKSGAKNKVYNVCKYLTTEQVDYLDVKLDDDGNVVYKLGEDNNPLHALDEKGDTIRDKNGNFVFVPDSMMYTKDVHYYDTIQFDFADGAYDETVAGSIGNSGIHRRGCGESEFSPYYSLENDSMIAIYFNKPVISMDTVYDKKGNPVVNEETGEVVLEANYGITEDERIDYLRNLIIDECALELAFEGYRFTDLIRWAEATGDVDVLAKRVAGRAFENKVSYYYPADKYQYDDALYQKLLNKDNWYLPLNE